MPTKISPMTTYYVRKLYRKKDPYLSQVEDMGDDFSTFLDLDQTLKSLYSTGEVDLMARQLETLVQYHQGLTSQTPTPQSQLQDIEQRIFAILGDTQSAAPPKVPAPPPPAAPAKPSVTVQQLLKILNQLQTESNTYLGAAITNNYLQSARPNEDWFEQFQIQRSQPVTFTGNPSQALDNAQRELSKKWVKGFIRSCALVIVKFPEIVNLTELLAQL